MTRVVRLMLRALATGMAVRGGTNIFGPLARADLDPMSPVNIIRNLE